MSLMWTIKTKKVLPHFLILFTFPFHVFASEQALPLTEYHQKSRTRINANFDAVQGKINKGQEFGFDGSYQYFEKNQISLSYFRRTKIYGDLDPLSDNVYKLGHTWSGNSRFYLETWLSYSHNPKFSSEWTFFAEPHYVFFPELDASLGVQTSRYPVNSVITISPALGSPVGENFYSQFRAFFVLGDRHLVSSFKGDIKYTHLEKYSLRLNFASGKSYESPGVHDPFYSVGSTIGYQIVNAWLVQLNYLYHHGKIRKEKSLGLGLEWRF